MGEKVRGAIFNALGGLEGLTVLDAYSGSGALAFESISRGASSAVAVDIEKKAYSTLSDNIELLGLASKVQAIRANNATWAKNVDSEFDLVFLDPPYYDINPLHLDTLAGKTKLGGTLVLSFPDHYRPRFELPQWQLLSSKKYAGSNINIYSRER